MEEITAEALNLNYEHLVIARDFNAKSKLWSSTKKNRRGEALEYWANNLALVLANIGNSPTCVRHNGSPVIDLTWISPNLTGRLRDWRVLSDQETLSDHQYITYKIMPDGPDFSMEKSSQELYPRWSLKRIDIDTFEAVILAHCLIDSVTDETEPVNGARMLAQIITEACDASMAKTRKKRHRAMFW